MDHNRVTDRILLICAILLFVYIALQRSCNDAGGGGSSDTVYVKGKPDTVIVHDTTYKYVDKPTAVRSHPFVTDSSQSFGNPDHLPDIGNLINPCDSILIYTDSIDDGACKAIFTDSVRGELLGKSIAIFSSSMTISRTDTLKVTSYPDKWRIGIGAGVSRGLLLYGVASHKRTNFLGGYDFHSKAPFLGVGVMISK